MKNVQKIAQEIFQTPTSDDLSERWLEQYTKEPDGSYSSLKPGIAVRVPQVLVKAGKLKVKFKTIYGNFDCHGLGLTTLEGCPEYVMFHFDCSSNKLTSLKGAPKRVGTTFIVYGNPGKFTHKDVKAVCDTDVIVTWHGIYSRKYILAKIAEDIFKAPSSDELLNRALEYGRHMTKAQLKHWLSQYMHYEMSGTLRKALTPEQSTEIMNLFPNGAKLFNMNRMIFEPIDKALHKQEWELIAANVPYPEIHWQKSKWHDKTLVRAGNGILLWEI